MFVAFHQQIRVKLYNQQLNEYGIRDTVHLTGEAVETGIELRI